jgi:hypothetical protein
MRITSTQLRRLIKEELRYLTEIGQYSGLGGFSAPPPPKFKPGKLPRNVPPGMVGEDSSEGHLAMILMDGSSTMVTDYLDDLLEDEKSAYAVKQIIDKAVNMVDGSGSPRAMEAVRAWVGYHFGKKY